MTMREDEGHDRHPRVVVYGYYGSRNLGDDLLLLVVLERLRSLIPRAHFCVRDHGHLADDGLAASDVTPIAGEVLLANPGRPKVMRFVDYLAAWRRVLREAEWLVLGGGTIFHAYGGSNRSLLLQSVIFWLARRSGVRLVALGVGVSDLPKASSRRLLAHMISGFEVFLVRDEAGLRQCRGTKAERSGDLVFAWSGALPKIARPCGAAPGAIALTVSPPACADPAVIGALCHAVARLQDAGHRVVFLVLQRTGHVPGDEAVFGRINDSLEPARRPEIRTLRALPQAIAEGMADIRLVTGMRFHALVLAAMMGLPFAGIAHDNKIADFCRRLGMPWIGCDRLDGAALFMAATSALDRRPGAEAVAAEREAAETNFRRFEGIVRMREPRRTSKPG